MAEIKKTKDKILKKCVTDTKLVNYLNSLQKSAHGLATARNEFAKHNIKFNQSILVLDNNLKLVNDDLKKAAGELTSINKLAYEMDQVAHSGF